MATIDCPWATGRLEVKFDLWFAEGIQVCGIGADESDHDEVAMDIVSDNSPVLYQSSADAEIPRNGADTIFLQSKFMRRYTGLIALREVLHRGSGMVGIAIIFFKRVKIVEYGYTNISRGSERT